MDRRRRAATKLDVYRFRCALGWIGIAGRDGKLVRLVFGFSTPGAAERALGARVDPEGIRHAARCWAPAWVEALERYARGQPDTLDAIEVDQTDWTDFQKRALPACRSIAYGERIAYGELAQRMGCPRAARAVGRALAHNPVPLVIPCHRVVATDGKLRGFSAEGGLAMKQRLLDMELRTIAADQVAR